MYLPVNVHISQATSGECVHFQDNVSRKQSQHYEIQNHHTVYWGYDAAGSPAYASGSVPVIKRGLRATEDPIK